MTQDHTGPPTIVTIVSAIGLVKRILFVMQAPEFCGGLQAADLTQKTIDSGIGSSKDRGETSDSGTLPIRITLKYDEEQLQKQNLINLCKGWKHCPIGWG
ncbi:hypothetical protein VNO78_12364 [Psophocarpus tetragonolobus]|uniref:Uncharacterized protein n=1 Tax=Psophocarpus tetragonolobus TaxID=3891 RepID=A0AAN9SN84_PSOTE